MRATKIALLVAGVMTSASAMAATDSERIAQLEQQLAVVKARQDGASWTDKFKINGFASAGAGIANNDGMLQGYGEDLEWRPDSVAAVQMTFAANEKLDATVQLIGRGNQKNWDPEMDWAYLAYKFDNGAKLRGGKLRLPLYIYSDYLDVGYAYPFARPSIDVYNLITVSSYTGADAILPVAMGETIMTFQPFAGQAEGATSDGREFSYKNMFGMSAAWEWDALMVRGVYAQSKNESEDIPIIDQQVGKFMGIGFNYDPGSWFAVSELARNDTDGLVPNKDTAYLALGARIDEWTPYAMLGMTKSTDDEKRARLKALGVRSSFDVRRNTYSAGVRWDFMPNVDLKLDVTYVDNFDGTTGGLPGNAATVSTPVGPQSINTGTYGSSAVYTILVDASF